MQGLKVQLKIQDNIKMLFTVELVAMKGYNHKIIIYLVHSLTTDQERKMEK
jgi:hypothetical protein